MDEYGQLGLLVGAVNEVSSHECPAIPAIMHTQVFKFQYIPKCVTDFSQQLFHIASEIVSALSASSGVLLSRWVGQVIVILW